MEIANNKKTLTISKHKNKLLDDEEEAEATARIDFK